MLGRVRMGIAVVALGATFGGCASVSPPSTEEPLPRAVVADAERAQRAPERTREKAPADALSATKPLVLGFGLGVDPMPRDPGRYRVATDRDGGILVVEEPPLAALPGEPISLPKPPRRAAGPDPGADPRHIPLAAPR